MPVTVEEAVTLTTGLDVFDGVATAAGKMWGLTLTAPSKLVQWNNPGTDLTDYTTAVTFTNNGKYTNPTSLVYNATTGFLYGTFQSYFDGVNDFRATIVKIDPASPSGWTTLVDDIVDSVGSSLNASICTICTTATDVYLLTRSINENSLLHRFNISTGAKVSSLQVTGTGHVRGHTLTTDGTRLYFGGTKTAGGTLSWVGWAELDLSNHAILDIGTTFTISDDSTTIGSYYWVNAEQETTPSGSVWKVAKDLSSATQIQIGYLTGVDGQYYDGSRLWVTSNGDLVSAGSQASALVSIDPTSNAVTDYGFIGSQTKTNEIQPFGGKLVLTTYQTPAVAIRVNTQAVSTPIRVAQRLTYF